MSAAVFSTTLLLLCFHQCVLAKVHMTPLPVEAVCQPAKGPNMAKMQAKLSNDCNKCCVGQKEVTKERSVETTCDKYQNGSYTTLAGEIACYCQSDFSKTCSVDVCQPAVNRNGSPMKLSKRDILTNDKNCNKCCRAQVIPNVGIALDHPPMFPSGKYMDSDKKCWCQMVKM